jgi:hypothetical protein
MRTLIAASGAGTTDLLTDPQHVHRIGDLSPVMTDHGGATDTLAGDQGETVA